MLTPNIPPYKINTDTVLDNVSNDEVIVSNVEVIRITP